MTAPGTAPSANDVTSSRGANTHQCANPECGHADVFHAFNTKNTVRKACSRHEGMRATRCPCTTFVSELPKGFPNE